jgi:hypothetical protein
MVSDASYFRPVAAMLRPQVQYSLPVGSCKSDIQFSLSAYSLSGASMSSLGYRWSWWETSLFYLPPLLLPLGLVLAEGSGP